MDTTEKDNEFTTAHAIKLAAAGALLLAATSQVSKRVANWNTRRKIDYVDTPVS